MLWKSIALRVYNKTANYINIDGEFQKKYSIYAFMVYNLMETIYDKHIRDDESRINFLFRKKTDLFWKTWEPIIKEEYNLHRAWFDHEPNKANFKEDFKKFINSLDGGPVRKEEKVKID
ncbi:hypothetical protein [Neobacillus dielmonensis]|uniref:hypothetical protein n=1 Tax=Neobacillus dielmonensis TaxID=1347369 RepID=UPI0005A7748E|nr:hypothetical protein [Neobacillus dielmonensis]